jgi:hypothetical protein
MTTQPAPSFLHRPSTRLGWWAVGLFGLFVILFVINALLFIPASQGVSSPEWVIFFLPIFGIIMALCTLAAGLAGVMAVIKKHERSWLVWLTIIPAVFFLLLLLFELLVPH